MRRRGTLPRASLKPKKQPVVKQGRPRTSGSGRQLQIPPSLTETPALAAGHEPAPTDALLLAIAEAHFIKRKTQKTLAEEYGVHPSTISRWLETARQQGFVHISVCPPSNEVLRRKLLPLAAPYGVAEVVVRGFNRRQVADAAACQFEKMLRSGATVVLDGGLTVREVVDSLKPGAAEALQLVPIAADPPSYSASAYELMTRLSLKYPVNVTCHKPPFWPDSPLDDMHAEVCRAASQADFVLLGVGPWQQGHTALDFVTHLGLSPVRLKADHPRIACVSGYLPLDQDGRRMELVEVDARMRHTLSCADLRRLASNGTCRTILTASSTAKAQAVLGVLRARFCTDLIVDEELATRLIASF